MNILDCGGFIGRAYRDQLRSIPQLVTAKIQLRASNPAERPTVSPLAQSLSSYSRVKGLFYFIILFSFSMHSGHTYLPPKETMCLTLPQNTQAS